MKKAAATFLPIWGCPIQSRELVKAKLTVQIYRILKDAGLTQKDAAKLLKTTQAQVSALIAVQARIRFRRAAYGIFDRPRPRR